MSPAAFHLEPKSLPSSEVSLRRADTGSLQWSPFRMWSLSSLSCASPDVGGRERAPLARILDRAPSGVISEVSDSPAICKSAGFCSWVPS